MNKVILIGRLGKDPDVKYTPAGDMVTTFSVATDESYKNREGEKVQKTEWHKIVAWGKLAEICGEHLKKGSQVMVEGKLQTQSYEDKEGVKRYTTSVLLAHMEMLGGKKEEASDDVPM